MNSLVYIAIASIVTILLRALPFLVFQKKETPEVISYLGNVLPYAIMGMLVVYCLREVSFLQNPYGIPELVGVGITVLIHVWKRNTLISILCGTISYMLLIQFLFI